MIRSTALVSFIVFLLLLPVDIYSLGGGSMLETPAVVYTKPADGSAVDLTGKKNLVFEWQPVPIPSAGRECYQFNLYDEGGHKEILSQVIDPRTFSISVPAEKFEDGKTYRWRVKQRDVNTMNWSRYEMWYFKIIRK